MKKCLNKCVVFMLLMLIACGMANAQCNLTVTTPNITDITSTIAVLDAVDYSTLIIKGSGVGPVDASGQQADRGFNFASQPVSGDFTVIKRMTTLTSVGANSSPEAGILTVGNSGPSWVFVKLSIVKTAGVYYLQGAYARYIAGSHGIWISAFATQTISDPNTTPFWLKLAKVGVGYNFYKSSDGSSWINLAAGFTPPSVGAISAGLYVDDGTRTSGSMATSTADNISINGAVPSFTDSDFGNVGGNLGAGQPNSPYTFKETVSGSLTFTTSGTCNSSQLNAIAAAKANGHYYLQTGITILDNATGAAPLDHILGVGTTVCATCSEPTFDTSGTTSQLFAHASLGYDQYVSVNAIFDSTFNSYMWPTSPGGPTVYGGTKTTNYVDGHSAVTLAHNQGSVGGSPTSWYLGPFPNYWCTSDSVPPDFQPGIVIDTPYFPYFMTATFVKRLAHSNPNPNPWIPALPTMRVAQIATVSLSPTQCTNWDRNVFP